MTDLIGLAQEHLRAGRYEDARKAVEEVLRQSPDAASALAVLADVESNQGNHTAAAAALDRAVALVPNHIALLYHCAAMHRRAGQYNQALAHFTKLQAMMPGDPSAPYETAHTHFLRAERVFDGNGEPNTAAQDLLALLEHSRRAMALKPNYVTAQRGVLIAYVGLGRMYEACVEALKYVGMKPNDPAFPENHKDIQLRLGLDKTLRTPPGEAGTPMARPTSLPPARRRDAWEDAAIAEISRVMPAPLSGVATVFYHVDIGSNHPFLGAGSDAPKVDYLAALDMSCRCARLTQPGVKIILLTDNATRLDGFSGADYTIRLPRDPNHLMYARMRACQALAMSGRLQGPTLFLDTDVCLNRDFAPLFDGSFEMGLVYRSSVRYPLMPINEGLMIASGARPAALAEFFGKCLDYYDWLAELAFVRERYGFDVRFWRGGQLSLNLFANWRVPPLSPEEAVMHGVRCRFFHCETHSYSVPTDSRLEDLGKYWSLHFKGLLPKALMNRYFAQVQRGAPVP